MTPELSRPQRVDSLAPAGITIDVLAGPAECAAIAARLGIPEVKSFSARFTLRPITQGAVHATARLTARMVRVCVVSLEPFETTQRCAFSVRFVPAGQESDDEDPGSEDEIPYQGGVVDLGDAAVEQLALDLDPFPRIEGAVLPEEATADRQSPFAALARLRPGR